MILKKNKKSGFVQVDNRPVQGGELSYRAIGILTYLLSRPDDWETSVQDLIARSPKEGITAVRSGLEELVAHDYAALVPMRDADSGQMLGTRYVVSDDYEWIQHVKGVRYLEVSARKESRFVLRFDEDRDAENPTVGKPERRKNRASGNQTQLIKNQTNTDSELIQTETKSKSHSLTSETDDGSSTIDKFGVDDWQYKAAAWWLTFLKEDNLLPPTLLRRKNEAKLIQEWADVLDKLNRIDGYAPTEISKVLAWLKKTKDVPNQGQFWFQDAKLTSLASVRKPSRGNPDYTKFDMIFTSYQKYSGERSGSKISKPMRG